VPRVLSVQFESAEELEREYGRNLASSGVFVATDLPFEPREEVEVELSLAGCQLRLRLRGEVVHIVSFEMADVGARPGVAVQFEGSALEVRHKLEPLLVAAGIDPLQAIDPGRRRAPRAPARVPARLEGAGEAVEGRTRNLSRSGALVSVPAAPAPVGSTVRVTLTDPAEGREMSVPGRLVRQVETDAGEVTAVAVHFEPDSRLRTELDRFVDHLQSLENTRRLGAISGPIEELGVGNLLQMFGRGSQEGTLVLRNGAREGTIGFRGGLVQGARLGSARGLKALERLLAWEDGEFEFRAHADPSEDAEAPLPVEAAVLEAARRLDEARHAGGEVPREARLALGAEDAEAPDTKTAQAVLDLARAGFTVGRALDVIPEPDAEVLAALRTLLASGRVRLVR